MREFEFVCEFEDDEYGSSMIRKERIVRCRDCVHAYKDGTLCTHFLMQNDDDMSITPSYVDPDGFCSWGKEREES